MNSNMKMNNVYEFGLDDCGVYRIRILITIFNEYFHSVCFACRTVKNGGFVVFAWSMLIFMRVGKEEISDVIIHF